MPENISKDLCPPCINYTAKKLYTMTTKGGKLDSGRTHIKLAYNLYRYFGGTGEHYRDFIEIYSNWRIKSKTSAKYFYGHDDQSLELHCQSLQNSYNTRIKSNSKKLDSCVKTVRSMGAPSDMCALCPFSCEYMNARFGDEQSILGYALYNRNTEFLEVVKLPSYADYTSIVYEDIALHFTGSFLKKSKDTNVFIGGSYNFHALLAYFILRHVDEFKKESSALMENIFSRVQKGPQAAAEVLLHELYKIMNAELGPQADFAKRFPDKNYAIKDMSEEDFKASFIPAVISIIKKAPEVSYEDYKKCIEDIRNVYTYTDYPSINKKTGRGAKHNEMRMTTPTKKKKKPSDIKINMETDLETAKTLSDLLLHSPILDNAPLINDFENELGAPSIPEDDSSAKTANEGPDYIQAVPEPITSEMITSAVKREYEQDTVQQKSDVTSTSDNITTPVSGKETEQVQDSPADSFSFFKSGIETFSISTIEENHAVEEISENVTVKVSEQDNIQDNFITDNSADDYYDALASEFVDEVPDYELDTPPEDEDDFPETTSTISDETASSTDTDIENNTDEADASSVNQTESTDDNQYTVSAATEIQTDESPEKSIEPETCEDKIITMSLPEFIQTPINTEDFFKRVNTLYGLDEEDSATQARIWIEKICVREYPISVELVYENELEQYGLLLYSPVSKNYYYIADDMSKNFNDVCWHIFMSENPKITLNFSGVSSYLSGRNLRARNLVSIPAMYATLHPDCTRFLVGDILRTKLKCRQNCSIFELAMPLYTDAYQYFQSEIDKHEDDIAFNKQLTKHKNFERIACYAYNLSDVTTISGPGVFIDVPGQMVFSYTGPDCLKHDSGYSVVTLQANSSDFKYDFTIKEFFVAMLNSMLQMSCFTKFHISFAGYDDYKLSIISPTDNVYMATDIITDTAGRTFKKMCRNADIVPEFETDIITK